MSAAPEPVLGIDVQRAADGREWRREASGRAALRFCVTGTVAFATMLGILGMLVAQRIHAPHFRSKGENMLAGLSFLVWLFCQLVGLLLGVYARRTKAGKAALITALVPDGVALLLAAGIYALGHLG